MDSIVKSNLCKGCGTCVAICSFFAIKMVKDDSKGTYVPKLDAQKCNRCGICKEVCPGYSIDFKELNQELFGKEPDDISIGNYLNCYTGYATDIDIRYNSSSGGLVSSMLIYALEVGIIDGALVTRMKKDNPLEPEPFIARTRDEIIESSKSKYCPVPANIALNEILRQEGKYAVVGLPCHLHGIRKAEKVNKKLKERIVLHLSIFCSGVPNFKATELLLQRLNLCNQDIKKINYRGKGWPGSMSLELKDDKEKVISYPGYWDNLAGLFYPYACVSCIDWFSKLADVSFGDAWLPAIKEVDKIGTSIIISRTTQSEYILLQMLREEIIALSPIEGDKIYESQPGFSQKKKYLRAQLAVSKFFVTGISSNTYDCLPHPLLSDYLISAMICSQSVLASKRSLWWLLNIIHSLIRRGSSLKSKFRL